MDGFLLVERPTADQQGEVLSTMILLSFISIENPRYD